MGDKLWTQLTRRGWRAEYGPKGADKQIYYLPPNIERRAPWKCRVHYFDSQKLVLQHLSGSKQVIIDVSDEAVGNQDRKRRQFQSAQNEPDRNTISVKRPVT